MLGGLDLRGGDLAAALGGLLLEEAVDGVHLRGVSIGKDGWMEDVRWEVGWIIG